MDLVPQTTRLNNGMVMPLLGLGLYQSSQQQTAAIVAHAIEAGYRLFDTASIYQNEAEVGDGVAHSGIARSDVFITTKVWIDSYGYEETLLAFETSRRKLKMDYVDLYLLHWPVPSQFQKTIASYKALERLLADGLVKSIGVSNFTQQHLQNLLEHTSIAPAVNQVELHPYFNQAALRAANAQHGIMTQSWSPLGGVISRSATGTSPEQGFLRAQPHEDRIAIWKVASASRFELAPLPWFVAYSKVQSDGPYFREYRCV